MKTLLTLFVLLLSSSLFAEDISDFEIEGMSIGDSLLDYLSEKEILENIEYDYANDKKMIPVIIIRGDSLNNKFYEITAYVNNDKNNLLNNKNKKYLIYGIFGAILYEDNITDCYKEMFEIENDIISIFEKNEYERHEFHNEKFSGDPSGETLYSGISFYLTTGIISIHCTDWSDSITREKGFVDHLKLNMKSNILENWLIGFYNN